MTVDDLRDMILRLEAHIPRSNESEEEQQLWRRLYELVERGTRCPDCEGSGNATSLDKCTDRMGLDGIGCISCKNTGRL